MVRAVIFDFNGVLVDDEHVHFQLLREVLAEESISLDEREYHEVYLGFDDRGCFETALSAAGQRADADRVDTLIARKAARYQTLAASGLRIFPGAAACIESLAGCWPVAICSGALRPEIVFALGRMGVGDRINVIVSAEDTTRCKPDPEGYLRTLAALKRPSGGGSIDLRADECLVVEDSLAGTASAVGAGMWAVGIPHTYPPRELRAAGAFAVVEDLGSLTTAWIKAQPVLNGGARDNA